MSARSTTRMGSGSSGLNGSSRPPYISRMAFVFRVLPCLAAACWGVAAADEASPVVTRAEELHRLSRAEILSPRSVKIRGVVTYTRGPDHGDFTVQDESAGFVADAGGPTPQTRLLAPGQEVEIEGTTTLEPSPSPRVRITRLTPGPIVGLPAARRLTPGAVSAGEGHFSYIEFSSVLRNAHVDASIDPPRLVLEFGPPQRRVVAWLARFNEATLALLQPDARVQIRGTSMAWISPSLQPFASVVVVHDTSQLKLLTRAPDPESLGVTPIEELLASHPDDFKARRERTRGIVTLHRPGEWVVLQSGNNAIRTSSSGIASLNPGDEVDASGFATAEQGRIILHDAVYAHAKPVGLPTPVGVDAARLTGNSSKIDFDSHYIRIRAMLRDINHRDGATVLRMEESGTSFDAILPAKTPLPSLLRPGSSLELTGVCQLLFNTTAKPLGHNVEGFRIDLPDLRSVRILTAAPWWNQQRLTGAVIIVFVILGLSLLWVVVLRRRVAVRSNLLIREIRARHDTQLLISERSRLAADLHDTLSQTLSGAALQLEVAESLEGGPDARDHRLLARRLLDRSREELRRAVWDLTPNALVGRDLETALRNTAAELAADHACRIEVDSETALPVLPQRLVSHLFRVGQEAVHNAIRHSRATQIRIRLARREGDLEMTIEDNGCGFDPMLVPGPALGHFGLTSMRDRVQRLGGRFEIISSPRGTRLNASVPLETRSELSLP